VIPFNWPDTVKSNDICASEGYDSVIIFTPTKSDQDETITDNVITVQGQDLYIREVNSMNRMGGQISDWLKLFNVILCFMAVGYSYRSITPVITTKQ
jgi:hypothetical protein